MQQHMPTNDSSNQYMNFVCIKKNDFYHKNFHMQHMYQWYPWQGTLGIYIRSDHKYQSSAFSCNSCCHNGLNELISLKIMPS